jgi:hypothetical protein
MELTAFENGELRVSNSEGLEIRYSRVNGNQLILCARMNDWDRFTNLWKKKTDATQWSQLELFFTELDRAKRWRIKEAFARLGTVDDEPPSGTQGIVKKTPLV